MENKKQVLDLAEKLQDECHEMVNEIVNRNSKLTYQDATNTFIFLKLAEIIDMLNDIKNIKN
jgi:hypothetical protein